MANKIQKIKLSIKAPKTVSMDTSPSDVVSPGSQDTDWQTRDDANKIRDYARLTQDPKRHDAAISHIQNEHRAMRGVLGGESMSNDDDEDTGMTPRTTSRLGRKASNRVATRGGGR